MDDDFINIRSFTPTSAGNIRNGIDQLKQMLMEKHADEYKAKWLKIVPKIDEKIRRKAFDVGVSEKIKDCCKFHLDEDPDDLFVEYVKNRLEMLNYTCEIHASSKIIDMVWGTGTELKIFW